MIRLVKIIRGFVVFFFIIFFCFLSCTRISKVEVYNNHSNKMERTLANHYSSHFPNENFVHLKKYLLLDDEGFICSDSDKLSECGQNEALVYTSASGGVVKRTKDSIKILTAAHWCVEGENDSETIRNTIEGSLLEEGEKPMYFLTGDFFGKREKVEILSVDMENDLCLLEMKSEFSKRAKNIKIAKKEPIIGEKVYTIAAPEGLNGFNLRLHFEGRYAGCTNEVEDFMCLYSIPGTYGTSGSLVLNERGELVGVISVAIISFNDVTGGPHLYQIQSFLDQNL